jgi:undecaprenyl diphosphate synthase
LNSSPASPLVEDLDPEKMPAHVAIIMDGNGRWAKQRLLNRVQGHEKGAETVRAIVRACREIGISHLTLYAFSTENWQRPKIEVQALMKLLVHFLESEQDELVENDIRLNTIGETERLTTGAREALARVMHLTETKKAMTLHLALSYGSRSEIVRMVQLLAQKVRSEPVYPEYTRSGSSDSDQRRDAHQQFSALADCLHGNFRHTHPVAGFQPGRVPGHTKRISAAGSALRKDRHLGLTQK